MEKKSSATGVRKNYQRLEDIIGCKWSVSVIQAVRTGVCRPGELVRAIEGISTKVLNERLRRLTDYGVLTRTAYAELPPRVEYSLTDFGTRLADLIAEIHQLDRLEKP